MSADENGSSPSSGADAAGIRRRLDLIRRRIDAVDRPWTHEVEITAVTKGFPAALIDAAVDAGCRSIGENYAQELLGKSDLLEGLGSRRPRVDFIGQLQTNKVRRLRGTVDRWSTVDRSRVADEIAKRDDGADVLVQVNSTGEAGKGGCDPDDAKALVEHCRELGLSVLGLMTVGPTGAPPDAARSGFELVRGLVDELGLGVCSMGMSDDLDVAVAAGSTSVRLGTALFGPRPGTPRRTASTRPDLR